MKDLLIQKDMEVQPQVDLHIFYSIIQTSDFQWIFYSP